MLDKYIQLKHTITDKYNQVEDIRNEVKVAEKNLVDLNEFIKKNERDYQTNLQNEVNKLRDQAIANADRHYDSLSDDFKSYKEEAAKSIGTYRGKLQTKEVLDRSDYDERYQELETLHKRLYDAFSKYVSPEIISLYENQSYTIDLEKNELDSIIEWLGYFDNYEMYDSLINKAEIIEQKLNDSQDKFLSLLALIAVLFFITQYCKILLVFYFAFIAGTLYIRCKEYFNLVKLLSVFHLVNRLKTRSDNSYTNKVTTFLLEQEVEVKALNDVYNETFQKIQSAIDRLKENNRSEVSKNFDYQKALEQAKLNLKKDDAALTNKVECDEENLKTLKAKLKDAESAYFEAKNDLNALKIQIKNSYENLEQQFNSLDLLKAFFLGFNNADEPVKFNYEGEPTIIFYKSTDNSSYDAVMKTLIMMCSQIMCIMNPLAYTIHVVDTRTAGSQLSMFQVTTTKEDSEASQLFEIVSTTKGTSNLIKSLYEKFNSRRVKILGNYKDIEAFNAAKKALNARTEAFDINFFFHYDYKILTNTEEIKQLCRVCKSVGIVMIFMVDLSEIGDDKSFKYENLCEFLNLFNDSNLFGFNITDSVEIINLKKDLILNQFKPKEKNATE